MKRLCPICGKEVHGRSDKLFCCDKCRNAYHNRQKDKSRAIRNRIITALNVNYKILESLLENGRDSAGLAELELSGFRPYVMSGHRKSHRRHDECSCFNICYYQTESRIFRIRRMDYLPGAGCSFGAGDSLRG